MYNFVLKLGVGPSNVEVKLEMKDEHVVELLSVSTLESRRSSENTRTRAGTGTYVGLCTLTGRCKGPYTSSNSFGDTHRVKNKKTKIKFEKPIKSQTWLRIGVEPITQPFCQRRQRLFGGPFPEKHESVQKSPCWFLQYIIV